MKRLFATALVSILLYFSFNNTLPTYARAPVNDQSVSSERMLDEAGNPDKCGHDPATAACLLNKLGNHWGYSYDSLLVDLQCWKRSRHVTIDSIGASVQNRAIWEVTITAGSDPAKPRRRVYIHARTHPGEVQSWWVTREIIKILLAEDDFSQSVRDSCVFHIVPMYNPDGVELEYPRENANGIDIESNWNKYPHQAEVAVLKRRFDELMKSAAPIEVALNMHSAYGRNRYFVFHDAAGTSEAYAVMQRQFIEGVRAYFTEGIKPWNHFISWKTGTATQYPESWFWIYYRERVMALTYEDMNDASAGSFDRTAHALVRGVIDYLNRRSTGISPSTSPRPAALALEQNYPNPFNPVTTITYQIAAPGPVRLRIYDLFGHEKAVLIDGFQNTGHHALTWDARGWPSGVYFYQIEAGGYREVRQAVLTR